MSEKKFRAQGTEYGVSTKKNGFSGSISKYTREYQVDLNEIRIKNMSEYVHIEYMIRDEYIK